MHKVIIPKKMTGTGCIQDIASDQYNKAFIFRKGEEYAVVMPDYYKEDYTTHENYEEAHEQWHFLGCEGYSGVRIINRKGEFV